MGDFEKGIKRLTLAGIGAAAKSIEDISDFFEGKECKVIDDLAEKGRKVVNDGKETNDELHRKFEEKFDDFYDSHRRSRKNIDIAAMTPEEREELLQRLQNYSEEASGEQGDEEA